MKVTIIPADGFVSVNGEGYHGFDLSAFGASVNAIHWDGDKGVIELVDDQNKAAGQQPLATFDKYNHIVAQWGQKRDAVAAQKAAERLEAEEEAAKKAAEDAALDRVTKEHELAFLSYDDQRRTAYLEEADPLFFKSQRGEAIKQDWLDKIAEIKARFPKQEP